LVRLPESVSTSIFNHLVRAHLPGLVWRKRLRPRGAQLGSRGPVCSGKRRSPAFSPSRCPGRPSTSPGHRLRCCWWRSRVSSPIFILCRPEKLTDSPSSDPVNIAIAGTNVPGQTGNLTVTPPAPAPQRRSRLQRRGLFSFIENAFKSMSPYSWNRWSLTEHRIQQLR
jgi:hypothetical protein